MWKKRIGSILLGCCLLFASAEDICAAEKARVAGVYTKEQEISIYVKGIEGEINGVQCQIGTKADQGVTWENIEEMESPVKTLIMVDNSLSITQENREKINTFLMEFIDDKPKEELLSISVFSEQMSDVTDYTADRQQLEQAVKSITYQDQETYLTDVLYDVLDQEHLGTEDCYKRIIIISDGVDNKSIGYTKDEVYNLIKEKNYPIYTLGCVYKNNNTELENMFAIARMTGTSEFLLDEIENTDDIVDAIAQDNKIDHFRIRPETSEMDGSIKNVLLTIQAGNGEQKIETSVKMPLQAEIVEPEPEPEPKPEPVPPPVIEEEPEPVIVEEEAKFPLPYLLLIGGILLAIIVVVVILILKKKSHTRGTNDFNHLDQNINLDIRTEGVDMDKTVLVSTSNQHSNDRGLTHQLWEGDSQKRYSLCLTDINNPNKIFQAPLQGNIVIGRQGGLIIQHETISKRHCQISERNGKFFLKDVGSSNKTLLDGVEVVTEMEIHSGSKLQLGAVEMKVEIR